MAAVVADPVETNAAPARTAGIGFPILADPDLHAMSRHRAVPSSPSECSG
ncbi:MAG: hypothetical protein U0807_09325 [Candidatus Binatia bacterium]